MNKGFILIVSLSVLITLSALLNIKVQSTQMFYKIVKESDVIYKRLQAEKAVFDVILYNLYIYDDEDFEFYHGSFDFFVTIDKEDVTIRVEEEEKYTISLKYNDDCVCFIEILYE